MKKLLTNLSEIKREWFYNKRSYEAFIYGATIALELIKLEEAGAIFFDKDDSLLNGKWAIVLDGNKSSIGLVTYTIMGDVRSICSYVGPQWYDHDERERMWVSKREVKAVFKNLRYVMPEHFHSIGEIIKELK